MSDKDSILWILIALLVAVILLSGVGMMGFGMVFGAIMMLLFWGTIIRLVISLINAGTKKSKDEMETELTR